MEILFLTIFLKSKLVVDMKWCFRCLKVKIRKTKNSCLVNTPAVVVLRNEKETTNRGGDGEIQAHTEPRALRAHRHKQGQSLAANLGHFLSQKR